LRSWAFGSGTAGTMTYTSNTVTANRANAGDGFYVLLENNAARFYNNIIRDNITKKAESHNGVNRLIISLFHVHSSYLLFAVRGYTLEIPHYFEVSKSL